LENNSGNGKRAAFRLRFSPVSSFTWVCGVTDARMATYFTPVDLSHFRILKMGLIWEENEKQSQKK